MMKFGKKTIYSPEYYLDLVIKQMIELMIIKHNSPVLFSEIHKYMESPNPQEEAGLLDNEDLVLIIEQLITDKYISCNNLSAFPEERQYYVNFKGTWFIKQGGYQNESSQNNLEEQRVREYHTLTKILVFGTSVAAIYYILEILNHAYKIYPYP